MRFDLDIVASRRGVALLMGVLILLGGCTSAEPSENATPRSGATSTPAASPAGHTIVDCAMSRPIEDSESPTSDDLMIGPLRYPGLAHGYPSSTPSLQDGILFAKIGAELLPDATVTVSVGSDARSWAGIATEGGPPAGYSSVTYVSCAKGQNTDGVWWVGGFTLRNRTSGCLPLDVHVQGEESIRHTTVSFWDDTCA